MIWNWMDLSPERDKQRDRERKRERERERDRKDSFTLYKQQLSSCHHYHHHPSHCSFLL
jgi:hypothetical protein